MNFNDILGGVLKSVTNSSNGKQSDLGNILNSVLGSVGNSAGQSKSDLGSLLNGVLGAAKGSVNEAKSGDTSAITKMGGSAALIGILSMVLGRNGGSKLTKLGSLAALGSMAYQAYQDYAKKQSAAQAQQPTQLAETQFEQTEASSEQSGIMLRAMIAAAMSDGELDEQETAMLDSEGAQNPAAQQVLMQEIQSPMTPAQIAAAVNGNTALAAQVYLASRMVCQELSRKEVVYLAQLAEALKLDEALVEQLEKQAGF